MTQSFDRSALMGRIGSKDTHPEMRLRRALWARGLRYRLHSSSPVGRPDLVFKGPQVAVFVDGCFWHGCPQHYVSPRSRSTFWSRKLRENVDRDRGQTLGLEDLGWAVCRFWEHEVFESLDRVVGIVQAAVVGRPPPRAFRWQVVQVVPLDEQGARERREMEALRDGSVKKAVVQARSTKKWQLRDDD